MSSSRTVKVGLHLPETERIVGWQETAALVRAAEDGGLDSIWMPDHLLYRSESGEVTGPWECWSMLCAIAAITNRVELGPLVFCTGFRNPALIAKMADTLDEISGGRLILGLGAGWNEPEYAAYGFPYDHRFSRFEEAFTIIRTLLKDGQIDFEGTYFSARDCELRPRGPRPEGPPLMIGSKGGKMLELALPHVQYWNGWPRWWGNDPVRLGNLIAEVDTVAAAQGLASNSFQRTTAVFIRLQDIPTLDNQNDPDAPHFTGSDEEIAQFLREVTATGIDHIQVVVDPITVPGVERLCRIVETLT
jgi:alkanesulfonate monooxygenase SsuD/methylene tetrahydromethanopterin reductase-like flavin-dependent oxidoreductase (luciferase family)